MTNLLCKFVITRQAAISGLLRDEILRSKILNSTQPRDDAAASFYEARSYNFASKNNFPPRNEPPNGESRDDAKGIILRDYTID